jgi:3-phenylpropionate/trans-cinnamate dioxygenase ferredoxin subunit
VSTATWHRVCAVGDLADESAMRVEIEGQAICLAKSGGEVFALEDVCSHAEVSLSEGEVEDFTVECWLHGSRFDLRTGKPSGLPATKPVSVYPTTVDGDHVLVALEPN